MPLTLLNSRSWRALAVSLIALAASEGASLAQQSGAPTNQAAQLQLRGNDGLDSFANEPPPLDGDAPKPQAARNDVQADTDPLGPLPPPLRSSDPRTGKTKKPVRQMGPKKAVNPHALPALKPYPTSAPARLKARLRPTTADDADTLPEPLPAPTIAVQPTLEPRHRPRVDPDPYKPLGIDAGTLRLTPYVETDGGYDSNPQQASKNVKGSAFSRVEGGVGIESDWDNHSLTGNLKSGYNDYFQNHASDRPDASGVLDSRIDVTRDVKIDLEGRFNLTSQSATSPELASSGTATVIGRPLVETYGATAGITRTFGRLSLSLRGSVDRTTEEDAKFTDGTTDKLSSENYTAYGLRARAAYEVTPGVSPFVEGFGDVRRHDTLLDSGGYDRNSVGGGADIGTSFELTRKLTGEISGGYENRSYADKRLADLRGPLIDGKLIWSATPLTTVTFNTSTSFNETNLAGATGAVSRQVSAEISHALLRNLTLSGLVSYQNTAYTGSPLTQNQYDLTVKADYNLTRSVVVRGSFTHERLTSSTAGSDYTQNVFLLGLRLQR